MITSTSNLPAPILQSLAPGMLSVPTPNFNYIIAAEKYSMPRQGGTTMRFLRPVPLQPPVVQLGNSGIEPASQVATREILDAAMAFYGTSVILNEQVVIQDQDPVLSWVTERLGVAMRQAEDLILDKDSAVIKKDGRIFVAYSASATNHNYCMGLLWANEDADLLNAASWNKSPGPVFYTSEELKRYGPGHNSFTTSEDGKSTIMIYHARDYKEIQGHELSDKNRATRARKVNWTKSGFPDFMQNEKD